MPVLRDMRWAVSQEKLGEYSDYESSLSFIKGRWKKDRVDPLDYFTAEKSFNRPVRDTSS